MSETNTEDNEYTRYEKDTTYVETIFGRKGTNKRLTEDENRLPDEVKIQLHRVRTRMLRRSPDQELYHEWLRAKEKVAVDRINELGDKRWTSETIKFNYWKSPNKLVHCHACNYKCYIFQPGGDIQELMDEQEIAQIKSHEEICKTGLYEYEYN